MSCGGGVTGVKRVETGSKPRVRTSIVERCPVGCLGDATYTP